MRHDAEGLLATLRISIPSVAAIVSGLSGGQRQAVAVSRALSRESCIFLMDEPTAALGVAESEKVVSIIEDLRQKGAGIVVISHNIAHVFGVTDRICVLRHGRITLDRCKENTTPEEVVCHIVGVAQTV